METVTPTTAHWTTKVELDNLETLQYLEASFCHRIPSSHGHQKADITVPQHFKASKKAPILSCSPLFVTKWGILEYVPQAVSTGLSWNDRKYDKDQIMWVVFAQVFGFLNDNRKPMGTVVAQGHPKQEIKLKYSGQKPWTFAAGSISHRHIGLPVTQLYSKTNKQTKMLHRKKITPIYAVTNAAIVECIFKTSISW